MKTFIFGFGVGQIFTLILLYMGHNWYLLNKNQIEEVDE